jgi:ADP-heptose:LPS heptosyltransferase
VKISCFKAHGLHTLHNILIIRLSSIGDIILTTPLLRCVRNAFPDATITFVVKKQYAELLSSSPHIDHLIAFDHKKGFSELKKLKIELRAEKFDLFIDIHKNLRSFYLRAGLGARKVTSYGK